ncbi:hypothetical protein Vadar_028305 [Vaccinium darrowii]|uniref:Uncharacterized protein n=1 Tax=Vaccinium darrowii TaxID=229202 RepID=A0ACB7XLB0_9ERIC|nr:hypothetical protein Vadar_028305 [Vaccinium darrowii]
MGNGNRSTSSLVDCTEKTAAAAASMECDVGLGLRIQSTQSFPSTRTMPHYSSSESMGVVGFGGDGGSGPLYCALSNQVPCFSDTYDVFSSGSVSGGPRTLHPSNSSFKSSGGDMAAAAKVTFTEAQWEELERQAMIFKYMMASLPVPPQLLNPTSKSSSPLPSASQSHMSGFSRGSDPEPWRCKRTDGKKWRCSRDVAPNQKYCERHAHKTKPRSRKPVELPSHNTTNKYSNTSSIKANNFNTSNSLFNPTTAQKPTFHIPTMAPGPTYAQPRCTEWLMKGDSVPGSTLDQQWQQQMVQSSSREGLKRYNEEDYRNWSVFQQHYDEQQGSINTNLNSYFDIDDGQRLHNQQPKTGTLLGGLNVDQARTTRRFIDAWSSGEGEEIDELRNRYPVSSKGKLPLSSSLTLSMSRNDGIDDESRNAQLGLGMMDPESESGGGGLKSQWLNPVSWMGSSPGGPLGEALCLGIASSATKEAYNIPSPHCYSNSSTTSSCSKSSCEDAGHGLLHFH